MVCQGSFRDDRFQVAPCGSLHDLATEEGDCYSRLMNYYQWGTKDSGVTHSKKKPDKHGVAIPFELTWERSTLDARGGQGAYVLLEVEIDQRGLQVVIVFITYDPSNDPR